MSRRPLKVMVGLASVGLLAAACGSSSATNTTTTQAGKAATGTPIPVGQIYPATGANLALPELGNSLKASIAGLNNSGGINGHPVKLIQCDSQGDSNTEVQCAQTMVKDHVVATLEDSTFSNPAQVNTILHGAGIPRIGLTSADVSDYSNPDNFDFTGGGIFTLVGMMENLVNKGDKKISVVVPDEPQSTETHLLLDPIATAEGAKVVNYVLVSSASGDYSQYVAQAEQNGAQGMVLALPNAQLVQMAQVINQLNPKIDYTTGIAGFTLTQLKDLGAFSKKVSFVWWTPGIDDTKNFPGLDEPIATLTANMPGANINNMTSTSLSSWLAVHAFDEVMKSQPGTPTAASVLAAFKAAKDIPMNGIIKPWSPGAVQSAGSLSSVFTNVSNPWMYRISYNGTSTQTSPSELFNTFAGLPGNSTSSGSTSSTS
jgi:ABC-type branched-subunit amino acid transport system substrate-binding protein